MRNHIRWVGFALALAAIPALAQNPTGTLSGRVSADGEPLAGVSVTVSSDALQGSRTAVTTANGDYILPFLAPGDYQVSFEMEGMETVRQAVKISAGQTTSISAEMQAGALAEEIIVTGTLENISSTIQAAVTYEKEAIAKLPVARDIRNTVLLAPGVNPTGPNQNISISGSQSHENLFLLNGVVITENIRGQPFNLFIEDAIEETTISTSGISAEFGRFAGGVINTITKQGGNDFSGSVRTSFSNDDWVAKTPLTTEQQDKVNEIYEATVGGRIVRDRLWFFLAGRDFETLETEQTTRTNFPFPETIEEERYEGKLTFSLGENHRLVGSYLEIDRAETNWFGSILDLRSLNQRELPQELRALHYTGILTSNFFFEGQYSEREFSFVNSGSKFTDLINGTLLVDDATGFRWWSPTFCGVCTPEERNNENFLAKASWLLSTDRLGSHDFVFGYDTFTDIRTANNHQSGSDFRLIVSGFVFGPDGQPAPVIQPRAGTVTRTRIQFNPILKASEGTDFKTNSFFLNDRWRLSDRWTFNLGVRYDENDGADAAGQKVVDDSEVSPRVGLTFDVKGDGDWLFNAAYARYVTAIANSQADASSPGGQPATFQWAYDGPAINAPGTPFVTSDAAIQQVLNWFDSIGGTNNSTLLVFQSVPGFTTQIDQSLASPSTDEWAVGVSKRLGNRGLVRADYVRREGHDFYTQRQDIGTGKVTLPSGRPADLGFRRNEDDLLERTYDGIHTHARYRFGDRLDLGASYTLSNAEGNWDGETGPSGPVASAARQYPEYREARWNYPTGDLAIDQRHRAKLWGTYRLLSNDHHQVALGFIQSYASGTPYGADGTIDPRAFVTNPGYVTPPSSVDYFFTGRDAFRTDDITSTDLSVNYAFTWRGVEIFLQPHVLNVFNEDGVEFVDTTVQTRRQTSTLQAFNPFTETPVEGVHWRKGPDFGKPTRDTHFQTPRTYRFSVGVRF